MIVGDDGEGTKKKENMNKAWEIVSDDYVQGDYLKFFLEDPEVVCVIMKNTTLI